MKSSTDSNALLHHYSIVRLLLLDYVNGRVQDCIISIADALEIQWPSVWNLTALRSRDCFIKALQYEIWFLNNLYRAVWSNVKPVCLYFFWWKVDTVCIRIIIPLYKCITGNWNHATWKIRACPSQAGKLALARSPMRVKIWSGEWKTGLGEWNFV